MKKYILPVFFTGLLSCQPNQTPDVIYHSKSFTIYKDKVVQGRHTATVISPTNMTSTYQSPVSEIYPREIIFKFSLNEKDNELPVGINHSVIISGQQESPVITFGKTYTDTSTKPKDFLPANYTFTFRLDMSPVIQQFNEKGYFEAYDGSKIAKADFKGVYLAGSSEPLSWDFVNLDEKGLKLADSGKDNIYTITVKLNPFDPASVKTNEWKLEKDLSAKPKYSSDQPIVDALFNLSVEEALKNIEPDSTLRTGAKWGGVWTRDISYSIFLAFAYHEPEIAKISLMKKVKRDRIIQDTGSGGAWPVSSDRTTWALAAWEIYKITGDKKWLEKVYTIIKNTLDDDAKTIGTSSSGLVRGESSFLDWREQTYPKWMSNADIYLSENLGTNVIHYQAHVILSKMAEILNHPAEIYKNRAESIKNAINNNLWMNEKGYYSQYRYGRLNLTTSPRFEALGEALSILFDVADSIKSVSIMENSPLTEFGTTCIYPQIPDIPPYHNNAVWPFVQSYWNLAAAKSGNEKALIHGLAAIYRAGGLFLTNYENMVASTGDFRGTEINSDRMLWSMAGNLAMVHRVFMGMSFEVDGIRFNPVIPQVFGGKKTLSNFSYRDANLTITVSGFGNKISSFMLDGKATDNYIFPAGLTGNHTIEIEMKNESFDTHSVSIKPNHFTTTNPQTTLLGNKIRWSPVSGATEYLIYKNGSFFNKTKNTEITVNENETAEYKISAADSLGWESFTSEPIMAVDDKSIKTIEIEQFYKKSSLPFSNYSGSGFIELTDKINTKINLTIDSETDGKYVLDFRYSNGSGPWNTDNKCAVRSLIVNDAYVSSIVFPQRGTNEWSEWGWSNQTVVELKKGKNTIQLTFEPWNINMNVEVNRAMLDFVRLIKL